MNYEEYLKLDVLLSAQQPLSVQKGRPAHDELLFISTHHAYEIWFKQILFELDSVLNAFSQPTVAEKSMSPVVSRLVRMNMIMKILVQQVDILETMTPMDFLEFRDLIYTASGFQSYQFRMLENKLGLRSADRLNYSGQPYHANLSPQQSEKAQKAEHSPTLFSCIENWLSRTPFLDRPGFRFWEQYKLAAILMFQQDEGFIEQNPTLSSVEKAQLKQNIATSRETFAALFDEQKYEGMRAEGQWRLSYKAVHAALLIQLYREQPIFQQPFRLLTEVLTLDSQFTQWRHRHMLLAKRMLGSRVGSGGSSGAKYLRETTEQHKIFEDFYKLITFFIPRTRLPELPPEFEASLGFSIEEARR
jgi:tryptophan 2,3-dioxygenase